MDADVQAAVASLSAAVPVAPDSVETALQMASLRQCARAAQTVWTTARRHGTPGVFYVPGMSTQTDILDSNVARRLPGVFYARGVGIQTDMTFQSGIFLDGKAE